MGKKCYKFCSKMRPKTSTTFAATLVFSMSISWYPYQNVLDNLEIWYHLENFQTMSTFPDNFLGMVAGWHFSNSGAECGREGRQCLLAEDAGALKGSWVRGRPTVEVQTLTSEEQSWADAQIRIELLQIKARGSHWSRTSRAATSRRSENSKMAFRLRKRNNMKIQRSSQGSKDAIAWIESFGA